MLINNSKDNIVNRIRDLPAGSAVPQATASPVVPPPYNTSRKIFERKLGSKIFRASKTGSKRKIELHNMYFLFLFIQSVPGGM
jgi:hypothetical protein